MSSAKRRVPRITTLGGSFNIVGEGPVVLVFANHGSSAGAILGGPDEAARKSLDQSSFWIQQTGAFTMARMDWPGRCDYVPSVSREVDVSAISHRHG